LKKIGGDKLAASRAVRALREKLGKTQEEMAGLLHCSHSGYQKWELGTSRPRGLAMMRMLSLCPDDATRDLFINPQQLAQEQKKTLQQSKSSVFDEDESDLMKIPDAEIRKMALAMMEMGRKLLELKRRGRPVAKAALKELADQFIHDAGMATNPEIPRGRKVNADMDFLRSETIEG
jgi:transcriptional regulator with XRE-family HTH domain